MIIHDHLAEQDEREYLEDLLGVEKVRAVYTLLEFELNDGTNPDAPKSQEEVAERLGLSRQTIYKWRTKDRNFIKYKNLVARDFFSENHSTLYKQLMKLINAPQPSVKALDIFAKIEGLYENKVTINNEYTNNRTESNDDIEKSLETLQKLKAQLVAEGNEEGNE